MWPFRTCPLASYSAARRHEFVVSLVIRQSKSLKSEVDAGGQETRKPNRNRLSGFDALGVRHKKITCVFFWRLVLSIFGSKYTCSAASHSHDCKKKGCKLIPLLQNAKGKEARELKSASDSKCIKLMNSQVSLSLDSECFGQQRHG